MVFVIIFFDYFLAIMILRYFTNILLLVIFYFLNLYVDNVIIIRDDVYDITTLKLTLTHQFAIKYFDSLTYFLGSKHDKF